MNNSLRKYRLIRFIAALSLCSVSLPNVAMAQEGYDYEGVEAKFYLSTKRVFQPGEGVQVGLESRGAEEVELRLYPLEDPLSYLQTLADPHRPKLDPKSDKYDVSRRPDGRSIISSIYQNVLRKSYNSLKSELGPHGNKLASQLLSDRSCEIRNEIENSDRFNNVVSVTPLKNRKMLYRTLVTVGRSQRDEWTYRTVSLPVKNSGSYLVEATAAGKVAYTVVVISDLSMVVKQDGNNTLVYIGDAKSGSPVQQAAVQLYDSNKKLLASGETDAQGLAILPEVPTNSLVFAKKDAQIALSDPRFYPASQTTGERLYLFTERPVYKAGQEVYFKGMVRNLEENNWSIPSDKTVEIVAIDPQGHEGAKQTVKISDNGTFTGLYKLPETVVFGTHRLLAKYKNQFYSGEFTVKHYIKPNYKVAVNVTKPAYHFNEKVTGTITGSYYSGGALAGSKVSYEVFRTKFVVPWWINADYQWYYNDTEAVNSIKEKYAEGEGSLDDNGQFTFDFQLKEGDSDFTYEVVATVTDRQDRPIIGRKSFKVTVGEFYLKVQSEKLVEAPGQNINLQIVAKDYGQQGIAGQDVELQLLAANGEGLPLQTLSAKTDKKGLAKVQLKVAEAGVYMLKAVAKTEVSTVIGEQQIIVANGTDDMHFIPDQLQVVVDKRQYKVGDKVQTLIITPFADGYVLATSEGSKLYDSKVLPVKNYVAYYETTVAKNQIPNFQISAAAIRGGELYQNSLSVIVPPVERFLNIAVHSAKEQYYPKDKASVELFVTDKNGKPVAAELAVAVVDEAIYAIQPELALTMEEFFYEKHRNNIRTTFSQLFRFYGYSEKLAQEVGLVRPPHSFGAEKVLAKDVRRLFRDTAYWQGVVNTNKDGKAEISFDLPDNLTSWRVTAWAITKDTKVGKGHGNFVTSQEVEVAVAGPSYLVAGDKTSYQLIARNNQGVDADLKLSLSGEGAQIKGEAKQVKITAKGQAATSYEVTAEKQGKATMLAQGVGDKKDAMTFEVPVFAAGMEQNVYGGGILLPTMESVDSQSLAIKLPEGADLSTASLKVTAYSAVLGSLVSTLEYLTTYPYGCVEQTMNGFLPDVIVSQTMQKLGVKHDELSVKLPEYIAAGITRLESLMEYGWSWYGGNSVDSFMTAYVIYGLAMAKRAGVSVPAEMLNRGVDKLSNDLRWNNTLDNDTKAFILYAMTLAGQNVSSQIKKMQGSVTSIYGKTLLALAMNEARQGANAQSLLNEVLAAGSYDENEGTLHFGAIDTEVLNWASDPVETTALVGYAMVKVGVGDANQVNAVLRWLYEQRQGNHWQSTRDTAMVVQFVSEYYNKNSAAFTASNIDVKLNGHDLGTVKLDGKDIFKQDSMVIEAKPGQIKTDNLVTLSGSGGQLVYNVEATFYGQTPVPAMTKTFKVDRQYYAVSTTGAYTRQAATTKFKQGQLYMVEITVDPQLEGQEYKYVMIEDALPAGVEIVEHDQGIMVSDEALNPYEFHREIRQGKVAYFVQSMDDPVKVRYLVRALYNGSYTAMPTSASLMYFPKQRGYSASQQLTISK